MTCSRQFLRVMTWALVFAACSTVAKADSLSLVYSVDPHQTAVTQTNAFTIVTFTGSVTNNTGSPITFQLTGGPEPFEPYVASFVNGIGFPGITLGAGESTGTIDLATVSLQFFDHDLTYPGSVKIVLDAVDPNTGNSFTENDASITVLAPGSAVPEPPSHVLLGAALAGLSAIRMRRIRRLIR